MAPQVIAMQRNWIGRREGALVEFGIAGRPGEAFPIFTTRPDTLYGVTFMAIAPEHPRTEELSRAAGTWHDVSAYITRAQKKTEIDRGAEGEKDGVLLGINAVHPLTGEEIPIYVADYVLPSYGTGAVMAVPAHDTRDFAFARKYSIPIKVVIKPPESDLDPATMPDAYIESGVMVNSAQFDGMPSVAGGEAIVAKLEEQGRGRLNINYRLRDWLLSRQRYWGAPVPMIHCPNCGIVPVPEQDLPVVLPDETKVDFTPRGKSPLASVEEFINTTCPVCGGAAQRDPDTMDTFVDSAWYFLRFCDPHNTELPFSREKADAWMPVDHYIGGIEHAILHLLYARFITKFLHDEGLVGCSEPFSRLFTQGMVMTEVKKPDGTVSLETMSKSKGNAVPVGPFVEKWGVDTGRLFILFAGPPEAGQIYSEEGVAGAAKVPFPRVAAL